MFETTFVTFVEQHLREHLRIKNVWNHHLVKIPMIFSTAFLAPFQQPVVIKARGEFSGLKTIKLKHPKVSLTRKARLEVCLCVASVHRSRSNKLRRSLRGYVTVRGTS